MDILFLVHDLELNNSLKKIKEKIVEEEKEMMERKRKIAEERRWKGRANENI